MARKIPPPEPDPHTCRVLAHLATDLPQAQWLAWVNQDGLLKGIYPETTALPVQEVTAATLSLGGRISTELRAGRMHTTLVKGERGMYATITDKYGMALVVCFTPETSPDSALAILEGHIPSIVEELDLAD
jgi:predicted regulator of Ras-like GTPase activity (Roadblock/LC7/MglB family)